MTTTPRTSRPFRFAAVRVLLTYSRVCDSFTKETVLYGLSENYNLQRYTIAEEEHVEGVDTSTPPSFSKPKSIQGPPFV